jgi:hypothetical protein
MKKCPWKCNNPGQSGSDACRIDQDCLKVTRWAIYLPDGTQIEKNLLGTSTRSNYDDIASASSSSTLDDDDIYKDTREILMAEIEAARQKDPHGKTNDQRYIQMRKSITKRDKNIDKIIQDYYTKFYDMVDGRKQITQQKNGHCC